MERRTTYGLFLLLFLIAGLSVFGFLYQLYDTGRTLSPADARVTATGLTASYEKDEKRADSQYLYKVVAVSGMLHELVENSPGDYIARLTADSAGGQMVDCHLDSGYNSENLSLRAGDSIVIRGTCAGRWVNITLTQCIVEK